MKSHPNRTSGASRWTSSRVFAVAVIAGACVLAATPAGAQTTSARSGAAPAPPKTAWGHPDLSGTWDRFTTGAGSGPLRAAKTAADGKSICVSGCETEKPAADGAPRNAPPPPDRPKYKPEFQAKVQMLNERQVIEDPALRCKPPGLPRIGPPPRILQTPHDVVFLYDDLSGNFFRFIPVDGRPRRTDTDPSYLGDAVGRWEGDTLVVETTNFNTDSWLIDDGAFHTAKLRVVERLRVVNDVLEYESMSYDPDVLTEPFVMKRRLPRADYEITEAPACIERSLDRMQDLSSHDNKR